MQELRQYLKSASSTTMWKFEWNWMTKETGVCDQRREKAVGEARILMASSVWEWKLRKSSDANGSGFTVSLSGWQKTLIFQSSSSVWSTLRNAIKIMCRGVRGVTFVKVCWNALHFMNYRNFLNLVLLRNHSRCRVAPLPKFNWRTSLREWIIFLRTLLCSICNRR